MGPDYDLVIGGGGIGGAALAKVMAEKGARVLVLEREPKFKDRIRGEAVTPWGVAEAQALGILDLLRQTCAHELTWFDQFMEGQQTEHRNLPETTTHRLPMMTFYHPAMQEVLLHAAEDAGAFVERGTTVNAAQPGPTPSVSVAMSAGSRDISARLIVGAGGRNSTLRAAAGFELHRDPEKILMAGLVWDNMRVPDDTGLILTRPSIGALGAFFPQGEGRVRTYFAYQKDSMPRIQGDQDLGRFIQAMLDLGAKSCFCNARPAGPLASFECANAWVEGPYKDGIALIGDAACTTDPAWGQGLSTTLRDVRVLSQLLLANSDWDAAARAYAAEHDRYSTVTRTVIGWMSDLFMDPSDEGARRRAQAMPLIAEDKTRLPDHIMSGPELPADESVRARLFGEDTAYMAQTAS